MDGDSPNNSIDKYSLSSDEICGEYPFKKIDYKKSHKVDILKQAANRIVSGKSTYQEEYAIIITNLDKYDRLGTPSGQNSLRVKFRKLIKKADVNQQYTSLYKKRVVLPVVEETEKPSSTNTVSSTNTTNTVNIHVDETMNQELLQLEQIVDEKYAKYTVVSPVRPPEDLIDDAFFCSQKIPIYVKDDSSSVWRDLMAQLEVQSHWHNP